MNDLGNGGGKLTRCVEEIDKKGFVFRVLQEERDGRGLDGNASLLLGEKCVGKAEIFVEVAVLVFDFGMSLLDQTIHQIRLPVV